MVSLWERDPVPLNVVLVVDPAGKVRTEAFFSTDLKMVASKVVEYYVVRWSLEVTFEEVRAYLGIETQRQ